MGHGHHEGGHAHHDHAQGASQRRLAIAIGLAASYMAAEVVGGWWTGSLALLADAGHMLSDVAALSLAWGAMWLSRRAPSDDKTFGFHRAEVLAAAVNGVALLVIAALVAREAVGRLSAPPEVIAGPMLGIAAGGLVVNVIAMVVLSGGQGDNLNVRGAFLHVVADALGSVGAMASGGLMWAFGWRWADPVASLLIAALVAGSGVLLLRQTFSVLMQWTPPGLDLQAVRGAMEACPGVVGVHDVHAWTLASGRDLFTAHVVLDDETRWPPVLGELHAVLGERFGLGHVTLQPEPATPVGARCAGCALAGG